MASPILIKIASKVGLEIVKDPEKGIGFVIKVFCGVIMAFLAVCIIGLSMIGVFRDELENDGLIDDNFSAKETQIYKTISKSYDTYFEELQEKMEKRRDEIIEENTKTVTETHTAEDGSTYTTSKEICTATVDIQMNRISVVYYFAYVNHISLEQVKAGTKYKVRSREVIDFLEKISTFKEEMEEVSEGDIEKKYYLYNEVLSVEEVGNYFFGDNDEEKQMFLCSYDLYLSFIQDYTEGTGEIEYPNTGMNIPRYFQTDYKTTPYGDGMISSTGCAPTSLAMVISYLTKTTVSPVTIVQFTGNKYYVSGQGSSWSIFGACASHWGLSSQSLGKDMQGVINALKSGKPVIASMGPGTFTKGGHIIVIRGVTEDGYFLINDPNKANYTKYGTDKFSCNTVFSEAKNFWCFS